MQIELPQDIWDRVRKRASAGAGASEAEVIRRALDWHDQERQAIQEGIDAWRSGDTEDFNDFDAAFCVKNGINPDA